MWGSTCIIATIITGMAVTIAIIKIFYSKSWSATKITLKLEGRHLLFAPLEMVPAFCGKLICFQNLLCHKLFQENDQKVKQL